MKNKNCYLNIDFYDIYDFEFIAQYSLISVGNNRIHHKNVEEIKTVIRFKCNFTKLCIMKSK